jgi:DNA-binding NarL/FixJ family response regulator
MTHVDDRVGRGSLIRHALVVCPSMLTREGMARLLDRVCGSGQVHTATTMAAAVRADRTVRPEFTWVHESADPSFGFVRMFARNRRNNHVAVLLDSGAAAAIRARDAFGAGACAVLDASTPAEQMLDGLRRAVQERACPPPSTGDGRQVVEPAHRLNGSELTVREHQVLMLIVEGLPNKDIAENLGISVETVRTHAKSTIRKLSAKNRAEAISRAFRLGIVSVDVVSTIGETVAAPVLSPRSGIRGSS